jgi:hypothetical protein
VDRTYDSAGTRERINDPSIDENGSRSYGRIISYAPWCRVDEHSEDCAGRHVQYLQDHLLNLDEEVSSNAGIRRSHVYRLCVGSAYHSMFMSSNLIFCLHFVDSDAFLQNTSQTAELSH